MFRALSYFSNLLEYMSVVCCERGVAAGWLATWLAMRVDLWFGDVVTCLDTRTNASACPSEEAKFPVHGRRDGRFLPIIDTLGFKDETKVDIPATIVSRSRG